MRDKRSCYDAFALSLFRKMILEEEKKKIARRLFELTDLSIRQIAEIVELSEKKLRQEFYLLKRQKAKYLLSTEESKVDRLFRSIDRNLQNTNDFNKDL